MSRLEDRQEVDASGVSVSFRANRRGVFMVPAVLGVMAATGVISIPTFPGPPWMQIGITVATIGASLIAAAIPMAVFASTRRTVRLTTRSVTISTIHVGRDDGHRVYPLDTLRSVHVQRHGVGSLLVFTDDDGSTGWDLGSNEDNIAVAEWLNEHLSRVEQLEDHPEELVPIDLARLSRRAIRERQIG